MVGCFVNSSKDFLDMEGGEDFVDNSIEHHPFIGHCHKLKRLINHHGMSCNSHKIGESVVHLTSYLGVLARTMVPIRYKTWHVVPKQLKDKNCMLTMGKCFRSFKNLLTVKYILPFEDQPELLKRPPIQYTFIEDEDWTIFVKDRLSDNFKDKLLKESQENGKSVSGSNDILVEALGTPEYSGRVRAKGNRAVDFIVASKEEQRIFQAEVLAKLSQVGAVTPQSDVSSSNMKQKQLLLPEAVDKPIRKVEDVTPPEAIEPQKKENIVAGGTIILECGPNYLVVVDAPYDSSAPLPIPIPGQTTIVGAAIGYQVLWPTDLVIIRTPILASKKAKKQKVNEVETLVGLILSTSRTHPINFLDDVFGESFKTFMMKEDMEMIISSKEVSSNCILYYIWHLHRKLIDAKQANDMLLSIQIGLKSWNGRGSKENSFHWVLVALEMKKMIAYYLDPMAHQPCDDLKDIVSIQ
ncbi:hypothetical protein AAG906_025619 [Vitis piasezkii]